jgi:hypothetical protein
MSAGAALAARSADARRRRSCARSAIKSMPRRSSYLTAATLIRGNAGPLERARVIDVLTAIRSVKAIRAEEILRDAGLGAAFGLVRLHELSEGRRAALTRELIRRAEDYYDRRVR